MVTAASSAEIRQPSVGQAWRYAKRDLFSGEVTETQVDQVTTVARTIDLSSHTEVNRTDADSRSSWGMGALHKYFARPQSAVELPGEIQGPWGMVWADPHWSQVQVYETPVPLWPARLQPGWHTHIDTQYKVADAGTALRWAQTMKAEDWETITVPAGRFDTLRYINLINFQDADLARTASVRHETLWFAPEVGRWVARESKGTYYLDDSVIDQAFNESSYRWELLGWS